MIREHIVIDARHGGPYDRGMADSYYRRESKPHYYIGDTGSSPRVVYKDMTPDEVEAYYAGYRDNEDSGDHKEY
jgi:glutamate synthase domain-containing protein 1